MLKAGTGGNRTVGNCRIGIDQCYAVVRSPDMQWYYPVVSVIRGLRMINLLSRDAMPIHVQERSNHAYFQNVV